MPFTLLRRPEGWYVQNKLTKKRYSTHPLHYDTALRQLKAIERNYEEGGDFNADIEIDSDSDGEGGGLKDFVTSLPSRIRGTISGVRITN